MLEREYRGQNCSIARALEIVGERWTLLIIRDAFLGLSRFDQFQESLGIARNVLTDRLNWLVGEGILERVRYSERPSRHEYKLTAKGRDLLLPLTAFRQWGDKYLSPEPPTLLRRTSDRKPVVAALVPNGHAGLAAGQVELVPGPGATPEQDLWWRDDSGNDAHRSAEASSDQETLQEPARRAGGQVDGSVDAREGAVQVLRHDSLLEGGRGNRPSGCCAPDYQ
jgi:DNA-binding HxlR family transcriptional regulator